MSKSNRKIDNKQLNIFDYLRRVQAEQLPAGQGRFKIIEQLREAICSAIKACSLSRRQIAGKMRHLLGETITREMIESWTRQAGPPHPCGVCMSVCDAVADDLWSGVRICLIDTRMAFCHSWKYQKAAIC